jgi:hypothetical protein
MNCIGCEFGREVWYEPWGGFGAVPGEPTSPYTRSNAAPIIAIVALGLALYLISK